MSEIEYHLPETFLRIVKKDPDYRIFLLEGKKLIFFPAWPNGEWNIGDVHQSSRHRRATDSEMKHYFAQIAPELDFETARKKFWKSVDVFGKEGSREKEEGIAKQILPMAGQACAL